MSNHGGKRPGAGRKPAPDGVAKTIETAIKRSKGWRDWIKNNSPES